jgi:hypothetical protein
MFAFVLMKILLRSLVVATFIAFTPLNVYAYNSKAQANAAIMIISACTWSQMGRIPRSSIMSFAKQQYTAKYGSSKGIDWNNAISIAEQLDKKERLGCFR